MTPPVAVGIARQSRGDEASKSIPEQTKRIREYAKREGWTLTDVHEEADVSGGTPLAKRAGLLAAVEAVEAGRASVVVVAYFDRLVRDLAVQREVVDRVEAAGGRVLTLDVGEVSNATAGSWLSGSMLGLVAEYHRRTTAERVRAAHEANRVAGRWNGGRLPFYYRLDDGGKRIVNPATTDVVREAFERRASGDSVEAVRACLAERGAIGKRTALNVVQRMLATEGLVDGPLFRRVQTLHTKRGARPKSTRLLARLGVLVCSQCENEAGEPVRMNVHGSDGPTKSYRCSSCGQSVAVAVAERVVVHATRKALADHEGRAGGSLDSLEDALRTKRAALAGIVAAFDGFGDVEAVRSKIAVAQGEADAAETALEDARLAAGFTIRGGLDWPHMTAQAQRELIRAVVAEARVYRGTGDERIAVTLAEAFAPEPILDAEARKVRADLEIVLSEAS
jgi:DNA invertase Pin-like site-specific DNA recombinase